MAEADVVRDEYQVRQTEVNRQRLVNSVRLEVESALVSLNRARDAYAAAVEVRKLQEHYAARAGRPVPRQDAAREAEDGNVTK